MLKVKPELTPHKAVALWLNQSCRNSTAPHKEMNKKQKPRPSTLTVNTTQRKVLLSVRRKLRWNDWIRWSDSDLTSAPIETQIQSSFFDVNNQCTFQHLNLKSFVRLDVLDDFPLTHVQIEVIWQNRAGSLTHSSVKRTAASKELYLNKMVIADLLTTDSNHSGFICNLLTVRPCSVFIWSNWNT